MSRLELIKDRSISGAQIWRHHEKSGQSVIRKTVPLFLAEKLRAQYLWLKERKSSLNLPQVLGEGESQGQYYYEMQDYHEHRPLLEKLKVCSLKEGQDILRQIVRLLSTEIHQGPGAFHWQEQWGQYLKEKFFAKIKQTMTMSLEFSSLVKRKKIFVNGREYPNLGLLEAPLSERQNWRRWASQSPLSVVHGDVTVENILFHAEHGPLFLDPNGENHVSSALLDWAKLAQSLHSGHELDQHPELSSRFPALSDELFSLAQRYWGDEAFRLIYLHQAIHLARLLPYQTKNDPLKTPFYYQRMIQLICHALEGSPLNHSNLFIASKSTLDKAVDFPCLGEHP